MWTKKISLQFAMEGQVMAPSPVFLGYVTADKTGQNLVQSLVIPSTPIFLTQYCHDNKHLVIGIPHKTACFTIQ